MPSKLRTIKATLKFPKDCSFEPPEHYTLRDPQGVPGRCAEFFAYWKRIGGTATNPNPRAELLEARWYIHKPKVLLTLVRPERKNNCLKMLTGPLWFEEPEQYMTEVPKKMGSGSWHVILNEAGITGALAECYFESEDYDLYPPQIDLKTLVRNDPVNDDYIRWLAAKGIKTPWDNPNQEEDDMGSDAVKTAMEAVTTISKSAIEAKEREADARIELAEERNEKLEERIEELNEADQDEQQSMANIQATAMTESMKLVTGTAEKMIDMVTKNSGSQFDPLKIMEKSHEFAKDLAQARGPDPSIGQLVEAIKDQNAKMLTLQSQQMDFMSRMIGMTKNADGSWSAGPAAQPGGQLTGLVTQLEGVERLAGLLGFNRNNQVTQAPPVEHAPPRRTMWDAVADAVSSNPVATLSLVTTGLTLVANIVYNLTAGRSGPVNPQEAVTRANQQPMQAQPSPGPAAAPGSPGSASSGMDPKDPRRWAGLPAYLEPSLTSHLLGRDQGMNGFTFAEYVLSECTGGARTPRGRQFYDSIRQNLGPAQFDNLMRSHPPIAKLAQENPDTFLNFLKEFFGYDDFMASEGGKAAA